MIRTLAAPPRTATPLSRRELEVLRLVSEGLGTHEIARALFVSDETVKTHVARILRKLHARSRAHAVAIALAGEFFTEEAP